MQNLGNIEGAEAIAKKSRWVLTYYIIYGVLGLYFVIGSVVVAVQNIREFGAIYIAFSLMFAIGLLFCILAFNGIVTYPSTPLEPIKIDDTYIYIYSKKQWNIVPKTTVLKVKLHNFTIGGGDGSDGSVILCTKHDKYKVRHIKNTNEVKGRLKLHPSSVKSR